ncbi:hypothetical protein LWI28_004356 [Acer negundo]|uniref:Ycf37 n=1 Tax=Acer negundo TaxID=4023 RepID=A0AAD5P4F4_ACENE|nr:hypothetical protein LWI28_004356 [Acer negundo]
MLLQTTTPTLSNSHSLLFRPKTLPFQDVFRRCSVPVLMTYRADSGLNIARFCNLQTYQKELAMESYTPTNLENSTRKLLTIEDTVIAKRLTIWAYTFASGSSSCLISAPVANAVENFRTDAVYEVGELFELGIQLSYVFLLLGLLGVGSYFVIRQVLVRRELDLSAKELQEQVRSGDASATGLFELGAVMLRRKFYPAATKYLQQAIEKWDGDDQDLAQVYNALGVSYILDGKLEKGITQFEMAVKIQPGYVTAWNNLGDAYEKKKDLNSALKAFEEVLLFDPNNKVARPRRDGLKDRLRSKSIYNPLLWFDLNQI